MKEQPNIRPNIRFFLFPIVVSGFLALLSVPEVSPTTVGIAILTLLPAWFFIERDDLPVLYYHLWMLLTAIFVIYAVLVLIISMRSPLSVLPLILIVLQIGRLFTLRHKRALFQAWLIALAMIVVAGLGGYSFLVFVLLLLFLIFSVLFLTQLNFFDTPPKMRGHFSPLLLTTLTISACIITAILFLLIPRTGILGARYDVSYALGSSLGGSRPGFTQIFYLGSFRTLLQDDTPVLEIKFDTPPPEDIIYLRGSALDQFDGLTWSSVSASLSYSQVISLENSRIVFLTQTSPESNDVNELNKYLKYRVNYIGLSTNVVFGIPVLVAIENKGTEVITDNNGRVRLPVNEISDEITLYSIPHSDPALPVYLSRLSESEESRYLKVPELQGLNDIRRLANQITRNCRTELEKARKINDYLRSTYTYSLRPDIGHTRNALYYFLFQSQKGHCELFATAMAMMLRLEGIPSRVVVGFVAESPEPGQCTILVKNKNAHVWVEANCDGQGWFQFDPTPPAPLLVTTHNIMFSKLLGWWEKLTAQTHNFIRGNSSYVQKQLFSTISRIISSLFPETPPPGEWPRYWERLLYTFRQPRMILFVILLIIVDATIILAYMKVRHRWYLGNRKNSRAYQVRSYQIYRIYHRIIKWLGVKSLKNISCLTLKEIAMRYKESDPGFYDYAVKVIDLYYMGRFNPGCNLTSLERRILFLMKKAP